MLKIINVLGLLFISLMFNCSKDSVTEPEPTVSESFQAVLDSNLEDCDGTGVSAAVVFQNQDIS